VYAIASPSKTTTRKKHIFNAQAYLASCGVARKLVEYRQFEKVYSQGDPATHVMYIQEGSIKLSVINEVGKEAVVAILGPGDFLGEGGHGRSVSSHGDGDCDRSHDFTCY